MSELKINTIIMIITHHKYLCRVFLPVHQINIKIRITIPLDLIKLHVLNYSDPPCCLASEDKPIIYAVLTSEHTSLFLPTNEAMSAVTLVIADSGER